MRTESVELDSGTLRYLRGGDGPLIVFSHALGPLAWGALERLTGTCTVAIPVWDRSAVPARTMGELGWFEALAAALGFDRAALCAWSMAGPAAVYYAAQKPAILSHLVLVDVAGLGSGLPPLQWRDLPHLLMSKLRGHPSRGLVRSMWRNWVRQEHVDRTTTGRGHVSLLPRHVRRADRSNRRRRRGRRVTRRASNRRGPGARSLRAILHRSGSASRPDSRRSLAERRTRRVRGEQPLAAARRTREVPGSRGGVRVQARLRWEQPRVSDRMTRLAEHLVSHAMEVTPGGGTWS